MTHEFLHQVMEDYQSFMDALIDRELLIDANPLEALQHTDIDESGKKIALTTISWAGSSGLSYLFSDYASIKQYQETIRRRDYNFCLADGAIIQLRYKFDDTKIIYHRLCYTPCPYPYSPEDFGDIGLADIPDLMGASDFISNTRLVSPIRFDFDFYFTDDKHAKSHLSLNKQTCRIPAYGPISLGHFMQFIFRYFYEEDYDDNGWWPAVRPRVTAKTLGYPRPHEFHLESSVEFD